MKHFTEAFEESVNALKSQPISTSCEKICLMVDVEGRFRVLAKPVSGQTESVVKDTIVATLGPAADKYWGGELWIDGSKSSAADGKVFEAVWHNAVVEPDSPSVYLLHRRISKDSWFAVGGVPPWPLVSQSPLIISFYSYKGGVGRSTSLASIAVQEARKGKRVLVIDFDLEAPGLASMFPSPDQTATGIGVVDFLLEYPLAGSDFSFEDLHYRYEKPKATGNMGGEIQVIPAGSVDAHYLEKLARVNYHRMQGNEGSGRQADPLGDLLKIARKQIKPDLVLIDSRAGLHDLGGLALSPLVHRHVLFGLDSEQSWRGLQLAIRHLGRNRIEQRKRQQECFLVQSMASPKQEIREKAVQRFLEKAHEVFSDDYYDSPDTDDPEYPVPDLQATDQPHFPVVLKHSEEIMGYDTVEDAADALSGDDYVKLAQRILTE